MRMFWALVFIFVGLASFVFHGKVNVRFTGVTRRGREERKTGVFTLADGTFALLRSQFKLLRTRSNKKKIVRSSKFWIAHDFFLFERV